MLLSSGTEYPPPSFVALNELPPSMTTFSGILPLQDFFHYILLYHPSVAGSLSLHPSLSSFHYRHSSVSSFRSILPCRPYPSTPSYLSYSPIYSSESLTFHFPPHISLLSPYTLIYPLSFSPFFSYFL